MRVKVMAKCRGGEVKIERVSGRAGEREKGRGENRSFCHPEASQSEAVRV